MKLLKKINNNFALGLDANGEQIIVEGRGIGFEKMPCDFNDLDRITRTYYDFNERYLDLINSIPQEVLDVANNIYEYFISKVDCYVNPNLPFILADHINFSIERMTKNIFVGMDMYYDLMHLYPIEYEVSDYALKVIKKKLGVTLPPNEKTGIILNLVNAEANVKKETSKTEKYISQMIDIIEEDMGVSIDKESFNYSRFVSHVEYLFKRLNSNSSISSENKKIYDSLKDKFQKTSDCVDHISDYIEKMEGTSLSEEEKLYLILHVNRLCERALGL